MVAKTERVVLKKCRSLEEAETKAAEISINEGDPRIVEIAFYPRRPKIQYEVTLVNAGGEGWS